MSAPPIVLPLSIVYAQVVLEIVVVLFGISKNTAGGVHRLGLIAGRGTDPPGESESTTGATPAGGRG